MDIWYYLMTPFSWLLKVLYNIFGSYGFAIILFSLLIKVILFPLSLKGKKGMIQMNMMQSKVQKIQKQYANNQQLANEKVQELYAKEGVNPMGGCLWSMLPLFILFPIYAVVRRPLKYWMGLAEAAITTLIAADGPVMAAMTKAGLAVKSAGYAEMSLAAAFYDESNGVLAAAKAAVPDAADKLTGINFSFLGIDLSATPTWKFWENGLNWPSIGLFLIPVLVVVTSFLSSQIMMKTNNQVQQNEQAAQQNKMMQWMSPVMMAWFSFIMPAAMGIYITANSVFSVIQEILCAKLLKADYERAAEEAKRREIEEKEEEKRLRREKAEQKARQAEEARKNKGKKKARTPEEEGEEKMSPEQRDASRVGIRQYARGRAYDPNRYGGVTPYHDGEATISTTADKAAEAETPAEELPAPEETAALNATETVETASAGEETPTEETTEKGE